MKSQKAIQFSLINRILIWFLDLLDLLYHSTVTENTKGILADSIVSDTHGWLNVMCKNIIVKSVFYDVFSYLKRLYTGVWLIEVLLYLKFNIYTSNMHTVLSNVLNYWSLVALL